MRKTSKVIIIIGYIFSLLFLPLVFIDNFEDPIGRAIMGMGIGLMIFWMFIGGFIQLMIHKKLPKIKSKIVLYFTLFSVLLILIEEAIATTMTNLATPLFGVSPLDAYITASTNYFTVIFLNSVVVIAPMYIVWGIILKKYKFNPLWVYIIFGVTGTISESLAFGMQNMFLVGFWMNIYGLTVALPAYLLQDDTRKTPSILLHIEMIFLPILASLPVVLILLLLK